MQQYVLRRLIITAPMLLVVTMLIFALLQLIPGDPLDAYAPPDEAIPAAQRVALRHALGLDQPPAIRYFYWLRDTLQGNLGVRASDFQPVSSAIGNAVGPTLVLMGSSIALAIVLGLVLGVFSASRPGSVVDVFFTLIAYLGISMPPFWVGLVGLYVFALLLHWFPAGGYSTPGQPFSIWDHLDHLILPAAILALYNLAVIMRYTRSSLLEVIGQDYIRTAYAKGLPVRVVLGRHALRNALLPIVTVIGTIIPYPARRRGVHRVGVLVARDGATLPRRRGEPRLPARHGHHADLRHGGPAGESADRPRLRGDRPPRALRIGLEDRP